MHVLPGREKRDGEPDAPDPLVKPYLQDTHGFQSLLGIAERSRLHLLVILSAV